MKEDEIIEMARQTGFVVTHIGDPIGTNYAMIEAFAKLVAEKERDACAEIAEKQRYAMNISLTSHPAQNGTAVGILNQIRARAQADGGEA